jgi:hypothetical protein
VDIIHRVNSRVLIEIRTMDDVQKVAYSNNTPSSQTLRFKIKKLLGEARGLQIL